MTCFHHRIAAAISFLSSIVSAPLDLETCGRFFRSSKAGFTEISRRKFTSVSRVYAPSTIFPGRPQQTQALIARAEGQSSCWGGSGPRARDAHAGRAAVAQRDADAARQQLADAARRADAGGPTGGGGGPGGGGGGARGVRVSGPGGCSCAGGQWGVARCASRERKPPPPCVAACATKPIPAALTR